jgi:hypothetical protein
MTNADYVAALEAIPKVRAEPKGHFGLCAAV